MINNCVSIFDNENFCVVFVVYLYFTPQKYIFFVIKGVEKAKKTQLLFFVFLQPLDES